jgi:hypothetical protein
MKKYRVLKRFLQACWLPFFLVRTVLGSELFWQMAFGGRLTHHCRNLCDTLYLVSANRAHSGVVRFTNVKTLVPQCSVFHCQFSYGKLC